MADWLIAIFGFGYLAVAIDLAYQGRIGLGIAFLGYAIGNLGLWLDVTQGVK